MQQSTNHSDGASPQNSGGDSRRTFLKQVAAASAGVLTEFSFARFPAAVIERAQSTNLILLIKSNPFLTANILFEETHLMVASRDSKFRRPFMESALRFTYWVCEEAVSLAQDCGGLPCAEEARRLEVQLSTEQLRSEAAASPQIRRAYFSEYFEENELDGRWDSFDEDLRTHLDWMRDTFGSYARSGSSRLDQVIQLGEELFTNSRPCLGLDLLRHLRDGTIRQFLARPGSAELLRFYKDGDALLRTLITHQPHEALASRVDSQRAELTQRGFSTPDWRLEARAVLHYSDVRAECLKRDLERIVWQHEGRFDRAARLHEELEWIRNLQSAPLARML